MASPERFWSKVRVGDPDSCWPWMGAVDRKGYGHINRAAHGENLAHRRAFALSNGGIPDGAWVLHACDNPPCCNPAHLFIGDPRANVADMVAKGRHVVLRGEQKATAKLTWAKASEIRRLASDGIPQDQIAPLFGVDRSVVCRIVNGQAWREIDRIEEVA